MSSKISAKQLAANRRNAQESTGPRTPEGKRRSSRNALKHGLLSKNVVITAGDGAERPEDFRTLLRELQDHFDPRDVIERMLVDRVAAGLWRLRRAQRFEAGAIRESLDECRRADLHAEDHLENLKYSLASDQAHLDVHRHNLKFLQSLPDLADPAAAEKARPDLDALATHFLPSARHLPTPKLCEALIEHFEEKLDGLEPRVTRLKRQIKDEKKYGKLRLQRRALTGSLPSPAEVSTLIRYETMLDRQIHRALAQLNHHCSRKQPLHTPKAFHNIAEGQPRRAGAPPSDSDRTRPPNPEGVPQCSPCCPNHTHCAVGLASATSGRLSSPFPIPNSAFTAPDQSRDREEAAQPPHQGEPQGDTSDPANRSALPDQNRTRKEAACLPHQEVPQRSPGCADRTRRGAGLAHTTSSCPSSAFPIHPSAFTNAPARPDSPPAQRLLAGPRRPAQCARPTSPAAHPPRCPSSAFRIQHSAFAFHHSAFANVADRDLANMNSAKRTQKNDLALSRMRFYAK